MILPEAPSRRVLAIDPTARGFGFVILEGPGVLVDWGVRQVDRNEVAVVLRKVLDLIQRYQPEVMVVEDCTDPRSRRGSRVQAIIEQTCKLGRTMDLETVRIPLRAVHALFRSSGASTKHEIANVIAEHFDGLAPRLPPKRKPWMSETERMAMFDAVAFALAFYYGLGERG